jgi:acyl-CoA thioester hydrolase
MRHVNNAVFLRYFETARISYLGGLRVHDPVAEVEAGFGLIFAECHIAYHSPVQFDENLDVALTICDIRRSSQKLCPPD